MSLWNGVEIRVGDVLRRPIVATVPRPLSVLAATLLTEDHLKSVVD